MTSTFAEIAPQRLRSQHLARPDFASPADAVRWFGAVQAQDYLGSLYAIGLRLAKGTQATVERAIADRAIIRTWPMRGTLHYVAPEDARWILKLLARRGLTSNGAMYRRLGLTQEVFARGHKVVEKALRAGQQLTRSEVYAALEAGGIRSAPEQRGLHILAYLARHELICFGPRRGKQPTFALLDEWIPAGRQLSGEEALAELARRYFLSRGPATLRDFAWWSGLKLAEARAGLHAAQSELRAQTINDITYWSDPKIETLRAPARPRARLLPPFDEFTVAYKDRSAVIDPETAKHALSGLGASILLDGRIVGTWRRTLSKDSAVVELRLLHRLSASQRLAAVKAAREYGDFVGLPLHVRP